MVQDRDAPSQRAHQPSQDLIGSSDEDTASNPIYDAAAVLVDHQVCQPERLEVKVFSVLVFLIVLTIAIIIKMAIMPIIIIYINIIHIIMASWS